MFRLLRHLLYENDIRLTIQTCIQLRALQSRVNVLWRTSKPVGAL